jgi:hypothetical protein
MRDCARAFRRARALQKCWLPGKIKLWQTSMAKHSRVYTSTTVSARNRPSMSRSDTKSSPQTLFGRSAGGLCRLCS